MGFGKDKIMEDFHRLTGIKKVIKENDDEFIPGLSDSDWGLTVNMITGHFPGGKDIQSVMMHNQDVIKVISKIDNPEIIKMIGLLKNHPEILQKLNNV